MRLVLLLLFCGSIFGSNDTTNEIFQKEEIVLEQHTKEEKPAANKSVVEIFKNAVQAYLDEDWDGCVEGFNQALHGYKLYRRMVTNCRQKCRVEAAGSTPLFPENIEDFHFYEKKITETLCLLACNQDYREARGSKSANKFPREIELKFVNHRIYEYLHICYYKKNRYQDAANALFTFLVRHPEHKASIETLKHYLTLPNVREKNVVNLESPPYVEAYFKGVAAYEDEDYARAVGFFENSLRSYLESENECRMFCEGPFDQGWHPEFTSSVANHFAYCLKCKRSCSELLSSINGDYRPDMLQSHYNYLQFAYYKLGNLKAACAAVQTYLLFDPVDETMLRNKKYYGAQPKVEPEYFTPREDELLYVKRQEYELRLLHYIATEFTAIEKRLKSYKKNIQKSTKKTKEEKLGKKPSTSMMILYPPPGHSPSSQARLKHNFTMIRDEETKIRDIERPKVKANIYLVAEENELGGRNRYVAHGFLNSNECESLMRLALSNAVEGDGYEENKSPHSVYEKFEGITIGRAALMAYFGQLEPQQLELLLEKTEAARDHVENYFKLDRQLHFTYTHLVCRTALPDSPMDRSDLSHEIHGDNCIFKSQNTCSRENPAYVWRDYSAIVYLNEDFEGGEFFFAKDRANRESQSTVSPSCGRMVAFSAGAENLHGVRGVLSGRRCALALWFTQDKKYIELERILADAILKRIRSIGPYLENEFCVPLKYEDALIERFETDELLKELLTNSSKLKV